MSSVDGLAEWCDMRAALLPSIGVAGLEAGKPSGSSNSECGEGGDERSLSDGIRPLLPPPPPPLLLMSIESPYECAPNGSLECACGAWLVADCGRRHTAHDRPTIHTHKQAQQSSRGLSVLAQDVQRCRLSCHAGAASDVRCVCRTLAQRLLIGVPARRALRVHPLCTRAHTAKQSSTGG